MARVGLALYLMVAAATGPYLCCCSGDRLLGRLSVAKYPQTNDSRCCNHRAMGGGHRVPRDEQHPDTPMSHDPCSCRDGVPDSVTFLVAKSFLNADFARPVAFSQEAMPGVFAAADPLACHPPAENAGFAFASPLQNPRDILSILQTLRC
ncbi:MAG: hypothetical protein K2R98_15025 [Gemmataceae bacterium]|nr:hypothetical protein [Gemmataceae bacterium]